MKELEKTRSLLLIGSIVNYIAAGIFTLISIHNQWVLDFAIVFCFVFGLVSFILGVIYPVIYKAEMMIKKMEEKDNKNK